MFDINIDTFLDLEKGNFDLTDKTLNNQIEIALLTNALDEQAEIKNWGWINDDIGNNVGLKIYQAKFTPQLRSEIKEEIRSSLFSYGSIENTIINQNQVYLELILDDGTLIQREFKFNE